MTDTPNPLAALLAGVPRFNVTVGDHTDPSVLMLEADVLAALTLPDDEAGKVLERAVWVTFDDAPNYGGAPAYVTRNDPRPLPDRFDAVQYAPADLITALLAQRAADAATIQTLRTRLEISHYWVIRDGEMVRVEGDPGVDGIECRDATIALLEEARTADAARIRELEAERDRIGLEEKMRMVAWCSKRQAVTAKAWQRAARKALAGDMSELRNRIDMIDAGPLDIVQSSDARAEAAEARIAALTAQGERLREAGDALVGIVEGITGAMEHGTWRDEKGRRLKDTPEWVAFYNARAAITEEQK